MRNMHYADVKANGCNATAIQFAMEFYHIFLSHTVVLAFILGKKLSSRAFYMEELRNNTTSSRTITKNPGFF